MDESATNGLSGLRVLLMLSAASALLAAPVAFSQQVPRLGPPEALEQTENYVAYVPDVASDGPATVAVVIRDPKGNAPHLLRAWQDAADKQQVTLLAPLNLTGTAQEQAERIRKAIALWEYRNSRKAEYLVALGYSLSTPMAVQAVLEMPERWAGLALTPAWEIEPPLKPRLGDLKGMPVLLLYSRAHYTDMRLAKRAQRDLEAAGCIVNVHAVDQGDNMQTTYHNGDAILAWVRAMTSAKKELPPASRPAEP